MIDNKTINEFYKAAGSAKTDLDLIEAASGLTNGHPETLVDPLFNAAAMLHIDTTGALNQFTKDTETGRAADREAQAKEARAKAAADIAAAAPDLNSDDPEKRKAAAETINRLNAIAGSNPKDRSRIATFETYLEAIKNYDESKLFVPKLFGNVQFQNATVSYIGARTGRGKTTAMTNLAREAIEAGRKTLFLSLEENPQDIFDKVILSTAYAESLKNSEAFVVENPKSAHYKLSRGATLNDRAFVECRKTAMDRVATAMKTGQFILFDGRGADHNSVLNTIAQYAKADTLILLDYIQKLPPLPNAATETYRRITDISASVVNATVKANAITIAGAQFNRVSGKDDTGADNFDDCSFRESGDLEQDAENAIGIGWGKNHYDRFFRLIKCRHGENGAAYKIDFQGAYSYMAIGEKRGEPDKPPKNPGRGNKKPTTSGTGDNNNTDPNNFNWDNIG